MLLNLDSIARALNMMPIGLVEVEDVVNTGGWNGAGELNAFYGQKHTEESRALISKNRTGIKLTPESIKKAAEANRGKKRTNETKQRISAANKGRILSESHIQNLKTSHLGNKHSEETKNKMSAKRKGRQLSTEHRAAIKAAWAKRKGIS